MVITPQIVCRLVDPTAQAHNLNGSWTVTGDFGQPLGIDSGVFDGPEDFFPTEGAAWLAAFQFLLASRSLMPLSVA